MIKPIDRLVSILCLIIIQLFVEKSFIEVLDVYQRTHSHFMMALLWTTSFMTWGSICVVLSVYVLDYLVKPILSYRPTIQGKLYGWLTSGTWLFCVTDAPDVLLSSQVARQSISMPTMSLERSVQIVSFAPHIWSRTFHWSVLDPSSGPTCLEPLSCGDDLQHCGPATSRRQGDWSSKTTPHPATTQCEIVASKSLHLSENRSHRIEYRLNSKYHQPTHKPEILQSPCVAETSHHRLMCSPYAHHLAGVRLVQ